eukprot:jgi/Tetstr1/457728/TSEL_044274.t1
MDAAAVRAICGELDRECFPGHAETLRRRFHPPDAPTAVHPAYFACACEGAGGRCPLRCQCECSGCTGRHECALASLLLRVPGLTRESLVGALCPCAVCVAERVRRRRALGDEAAAPAGEAGAAEGAAAAAAPAPEGAREAAPSGAADPPAPAAAPTSGARPPPPPRWEEGGTWHGRRRRSNVSDGALLPETCVYCHEEFEVNARSGASPRCGVFHPGHDCAMRALPADFRPAYDAAAWRAAGLGPAARHASTAVSASRRRRTYTAAGKVTKVGQLGKRKAPKDHHGKRSSAE